MSRGNGECASCPDTPETPKAPGYGWRYDPSTGGQVAIGMGVRDTTAEAAEAQEDTPRGAVLRQAWELTHGARQQAYGDPTENWSAIARSWSLVLGIPVSARQAALCMVMMKCVRDAHQHDTDNMADAAAYAAIAVEVGG